jgi:Tfp pilus assembly protein PilF
MREGFHADARRELLQAIAANPEEPTLHLLLADVYSKTRLDNLAAAEGQRSVDLSGAR